MREEDTDLFTGPEARTYLEEIRRRDRRATWTTRTRYLIIHLSWIIVLFAGAGVPLAVALDLATWVAPLLASPS